jgi:hypothetical protein
MTTSGAAAVTIVFAALFSWLFIETRDGSVLGLAERLTTSVQTCWPAVVAISLHRTRTRADPRNQPSHPNEATPARSHDHVPAGEQAPVVSPSEPLLARPRVSDHTEEVTVSHLIG